MSLNNLAELYRRSGQVRARRSRSISVRWPSGRRPWGRTTPMWPKASTTWRSSTARRASTRKPSRSTSVRWPSGRRPWDRTIPTWPRASTIWRCSTKPRASTRKRSRSTSVRWPSGRRPWGRSIPTWPRASTTWRRSTTRRASTRKLSRSIKRSLAIREKALGPEHPDVAKSLNNLAVLYDARASTRKLSRSTSVRWPSGRRPWGRTTPMWPRPQQPGRCSTKPRASTREAEPLYQAFAGHLGEGPGAGASRRGHEPQQPGGTLLTPRAKYARSGAALQAFAGHLGEGPGAGPPRRGPKLGELRCAPAQNTSRGRGGANGSPRQSHPGQESSAVTAAVKTRQERRLRSLDLRLGAGSHDERFSSSWVFRFPRRRAHDESNYRFVVATPLQAEGRKGRSPSTDGRQNLAHGVSRGFECPPSPPYPLSRPRGRGVSVSWRD